MAIFSSSSWLKRARLGALLRRYARDRSGNIAAIATVLIVPIVGILGLATEASSWFLIQRSMQNAADSAVVAAGQNALINVNGTTYITEANSVTTKFGFTNGTNDTIVTPTKNEACPAPLTGLSTCYKVIISRNVPIYLTRIVGFNGSVAMGTGRGQTVSASAMAGPTNVITSYCVLALAPTGQGIRLNGAPNADFRGCNIASNSSSNNATRCNGHNPEATHVSAVGTADTNCGLSAHSGAPAVADTYAPLATANSSDLTNSCGGVYNGETWSGNVTLTSVRRVCGNLTLSGNVTITSASPGSALVIHNGQLNLNNRAMQTAAGSGLTIVFNNPSGTTNMVPFPNSSGTLDFNAPTSGPWSGIAMYQNRQNGSTAVVAQDYNGNSPTWNLTGLIYFPYVDLSFSGAINKSSNGYSCFAMVVRTLLINGTGLIYGNANAECRQAGVTLPSNVIMTRVSLVQ